MLGACSCGTRVQTGSLNPAPVASTPAASDKAVGDSTGYPSDVWIGRAVYHVQREAEVSRVRLGFIQWVNGSGGWREAIFRATNPGDRAVLVWNVRQQTSLLRPSGTAKAWQTEESDYPGRGWEHSIIPPGGSVQFPMVPPEPGQGHWRVLLLYSREDAGSDARSRHFGGDYESIGPNLPRD